MDYLTIMESLIQRGISRTKKRGDGLHRHRIIPGREGGKYIPENISLLTRQEHRIVHKIRYKLYRRKHDLSAFTFLGGFPSSSWNKGIPRSKEVCKKQSESLKKKPYRSREFGTRESPKLKIIGKTTLNLVEEKRGDPIRNTLALSLKKQDHACRNL